MGGTSAGAPEREAPGVGPLGFAAIIGSSLPVFLGLFSLAPALPVLRTTFAQTPEVDMLIQLVGAGAGFAFAFASLAAGPLINRLGYRRVYLASLFAFAVAGLGGLIPNLYVIIISRVAAGLTAAWVFNSALVAVGELLAPKAQSRALGLQVAAGSVLSMALYPLIAQLAAVDWRLPFFTHLLPLLFAPLVLTLPSAPRRASAEPAPRGRHVDPLVILSTVYVAMVLFIGTIMGPLLLAGIGVTDPTLLALPPMAASIGAGVGSVLYPVLRGRLGLWGCFALSMACMAVGLAVQGVMGEAWGVWAVTAGAAISILGGGVFSPAMSAAAIEASPENPGPALGVINALLYGAMILVPLLYKPLTAVLGGPHQVVLAYAAAAMLFAALYGWRVMRRMKSAGGAVAV